MLSTVAFIFLPVVITLGLIRTYREIQWGKCLSNVPLTGRVFVVTGANSGIGKETVKELARRKAKVVMACRDIESARRAVEDIRLTVTTGELIPMHLDLASLESVRSFAHEVMKIFPKVHVLINNAGVSIPIEQKRVTVDGFEIHFGVNHLGHFLLTNLLLPKLKESAPSRIVNVSSTLSEKGEIEFDNLDGHKWFVSNNSRFNPGYCNSKLANVMFTLELAKRTKDSGITVYSVCPGFTYTRLFRYSNIKWYYYILFAPIAFYFMRSASKGAQTVLHCATAEELANETGLMYRDCKLYKLKKTLDPEVPTKLWQTSAKMVKL